jgi:hypothetical protein
MTGPLGVVFMRHGRTEQSHDPITGKLVDRSFIPVDRIHQDLETAIHDLMDFFRIELFCN